MSFFENIHETQITRTARQPRAVDFDRPFFAGLLGMRSQRQVARDAVREVLG